jgi:hypothetical protein
MVVNRLQNGLINLSIAPWVSRVNCQKFFFQMGLHIFFSNSDRDFYSENNTSIHLNTKNSQKKKCKKTLISSLFHFALNIGGISAQSHMLLFVNCFSIYLNAMHFDSFSLGARHLFQKLVLFFYVKLYL